MDEPPGEVVFDDNDAVELPDDTGPVTRFGDHWVSAGQRLLCADARRPESYADLLGNERARMCFIDPPFNTDARHISSTHGPFCMGPGELSDEAFVEDLLRPVFENVVNCTLPGAIVFVLRLAAARRNVSA